MCSDIREYAEKSTRPRARTAVPDVINRVRDNLHIILHVPGGRGVPLAMPPVPVAHQLLHHRLVH